VSDKLHAPAVLTVLNSSAYLLCRSLGSDEKILDSDGNAQFDRLGSSLTDRHTNRIQYYMNVINMPAYCTTLKHEKCRLKNQP
jgi:hypothetical protein